MHPSLSQRLVWVGLGFLGLSALILTAEYLLFDHVRLLALTVFLWLCLFYGLHRLQPEERRDIAPGVMESLCGFGLLFQVLTFLGFALDLSGWAAMAPMLVFLAGLVVWLSVVLVHAARRSGEGTDGITYFRSGDFYSVGQQAEGRESRYAALPSALAPDLLADPLGTDFALSRHPRKSGRKTGRKASSGRRARHAAE